ncbi:ASCH domain-containing protein [Lysinibacillus louembei]|uniref:ASCH domain-containing protein n=1 Tax=Lysinibacillus louembei TaxID=1470088 RepID=A0ABZ0S3H4_9BACI|nr:ASCH domain-containing protein [Lysinibacillus louembei]WPK13638.1 ASCH domain-containing protein [Lysinibacillus louembei]
MNKIQLFWEAFCQEKNLQNIVYTDAFQFGVEADWLADLVCQGKKTATTSGHVFYELENEALPQVGEYSIVLNSHDEPVAIIEIQSVEVVPMNEVTEDFALAEGEGDYQYWWDAHVRFFTSQLKAYDLKFTPDMLVVCERFKKVYSTSS